MIEIMKEKLFYLLKPIIPRRVQLIVRRFLVKRQVNKYKNVWPIFPGSEEKPGYWKGWPGGKDFAVVLTHDVELRGGHDKCKQLMELEKQLGFKSSFNFVPERYEVDKELRDLITSEGFEVGVHGLNHDGKLFKDEKIFTERAKKINQYLLEWNSVGFRAPAMHHNLEWIGKLNIEYDLSTFDTDPFEPQPDGMGTIFPFWVKTKNGNSSYLELPYTLVQDFTLYILMKEETPDIWYKKLNWIAEKGGMVMVNVHPDYLNFANRREMEQFPIKIYSNFLEYIKENFNGKYWNALPKEIAIHCKKMIAVG